MTCPYCLDNTGEIEMCDSEWDGWICTRPKGHDGEHVACASLGHCNLAQWPDQVARESASPLPNQPIYQP